jgi:oligopeptidase B
MKKADSVKAPIAKKAPHKTTIHQTTWTDDYFWMRLSDEQKEAKIKDDQTQDVLDYLNAENDYREDIMSDTKELQNTLYEEITSRIEQRLETPAVRKNGYEYRIKYEEEQDYPLYLRKSLSDGAQDEVMLNGPELAKEHAYFQIGGRAVSPDNKMLAYGVDTVSRRQYKIKFKSLETGETRDYSIENTTGNAVWANDNKTLFYTKKDPQTLRSNQVFRHELGEDQKNDVLVFTEEDDTFICEVRKSKSGDYIFIDSYQTVSTESRFISADDPAGEWKVVIPRRRHHEYSVYHFNTDFYYLTNDNAKNFRLMKSPVEAFGDNDWEEVVPHRESVYIEDVAFFDGFRVLEQRSKGLTQLHVTNLKENTEHVIDQNDPAYTVQLGQNPNFDTPLVRFVYTSLTTPLSIYDYNLETKERTLLKQTKVEDEQFDPNNYTSESIMVEARDGVKVPVSLVYKNNAKPSEDNPLLLYGYGSYGISMDPYFSPVRLSLLDRGFTFAIAHIRGGQEMGRAWYEDGKLLKKKNTFTDFIDIADHLVESKYTSSRHLYAQGGSAGGLLMGAVMNMRPDLWNGLIAGVPFVDVINTMLDESIPLTTGEFDEWGNPKDEKYFEYIRSYSPYDNVEANNYPNLLITTGYWDSQVQYWEPAKWIAKLRELRTNENHLLMYCDMEVGHGGASGRFQQYKEVAMEYSFMLELEK